MWRSGVLGGSAKRLPSMVAAGLHPGAKDQCPKGLEFGARVLDQSKSCFARIGEQQVLVVAFAFFPTAHHFIEGNLTGADVLSCEARFVTCALNPIPRIGAVRAIMRNSIPLRQIT